MTAPTMNGSTTAMTGGRVENASLHFYDRPTACDSFSSRVILHCEAREKFLRFLLCIVFFRFKVIHCNEDVLIFYEWLGTRCSVE